MAKNLEVFHSTFWINLIYSIIYAAYVMNKSRRPWNKNGSQAGTTDFSKKLIGLFGQWKRPSGRAIIWFVKLRVYSMDHTVWTLHFRWSWIYMYIVRLKLRPFTFSVASLMINSHWKIERRHSMKILSWNDMFMRYWIISF